MEVYRIDAFLQAVSILGIALVLVGIASLPLSYFPTHTPFGVLVASGLAMAALIYFSKGLVSARELRSREYLPVPWRSSVEQAVFFLLLAVTVAGVGHTLDRALYGLLGAFLNALAWAGRGYGDTKRRGGNPSQALATVSASFRRRYLASIGRASV